MRRRLPTAKRYPRIGFGSSGDNAETQIWSQRPVGTKHEDLASVEIVLDFAIAAPQMPGDIETNRTDLRACRKTPSAMVVLSRLQAEAYAIESARQRKKALASH